MARVFIGIGSNVGDRAGHVARAVEAMGGLPGVRVVAVSEVVETEPIGPIEQGRFLNAAVELATELEPTALRAELVKIEAAAGREPLAMRQRWGPRPLDLDILLYDDRVLRTEGLEIPHPRMHQRAFVLEPLAQIAPDAIHPVLKTTVADLERRVGRRARSVKREA